MVICKFDKRISAQTADKLQQLCNEVMQVMIGEADKRDILRQ